MRKRSTLSTSIISGKGAFGSTRALGARGSRFESELPDFLATHLGRGCGLGSPGCL